MKKILACVMAAALVCTSFPAFAADIDQPGRETENLVNFLVLDKSTAEPGETQEVIISIGDEETQVSSAVLSLYGQEDEAFIETEAARIEGGALLFEIDCPEDIEEEVFVLDSITYEIDGTAYRVSFSEIGIDAKYGVGTTVETDPDGWLVDEDLEYETETGVVTYDEEGNQTSANSIVDAIAEEQSQIPMTMAAGSSSGTVVVVLDPGHDSTHTGAAYGGLNEETLNLKIANYCREELETYDGVKVYMTRTTEACPFPGESNSNDLTGRVNYAASVGADVYVSIHLNANDNTSATGAQVYCPNTNYNSAISAEGFALADFIMEQLKALGLENRGIYSVDSSETKYPDGSAADYYAVIRQSKLAGFPGIIVEHAFMSNESDLENYLSSEESLKALGVADASGIANYYGLVKSNLEKDGDDYVYTEDGDPDYTFTGLVENAGEYWYFENGVANFDYTGFIEFEGEKWYVENGIVTLGKNSVIKDKTGAIGEAGTWYYVVGNKVQSDFTGLANYKNEYGWWYIRDGMVDFTVNTVAKNKNGWWYVEGGKVQFDFTGLANYENEYGWWYIVDGKVDFSYVGFASNIYGDWYLEDGKVNFDKNSVLKDASGAIGEAGTWYYVVESKVQTDYTGVADYKNSNGWWYIAEGAVDFDYNGFGENVNGKWYCEGGKVKFDKNSVIKDASGAIGEAGTWYYVVGSKVQTDFTGLANYKNSYGWWYIVDGEVDFTHSGVEKNKNGWWYVEDGKVDFSYNGVAENGYGWWYIANGKVDFSYNGTVAVSGYDCLVENGKLVSLAA